MGSKMLQRASSSSKVAILAEREEIIQEKISGYDLHKLNYQEGGSSEIARDLPRPNLDELS